MNQNLDNEILWYEDNPWINAKHFLMRWPFVNTQRHAYAYKIARENVRGALKNYLKKNEIQLQKALIAPCGVDGDQDVLKGLSRVFYGIDISQKAIELCTPKIKKKVGDIIKSGYESGFFDAVASLLFFHHLPEEQFASYLREFYRILNNEGLLFILEPSRLYPLSRLMSLGRMVFGNISGLVPDEAPIYPSKLSSALVNAGFEVELLQSVSFSHVRIPLPIQKVINSLPKAVLRTPAIREMGWMVLWICKKP
ncbi:MAG TPA: class I SAM-dependent methyltransferase [bacterium]|nr:class I SAM-dependent methyltransferase [bacterium]